MSKQANSVSCLVPVPRLLRKSTGSFVLPDSVALQREASLPSETASAITMRLQSTIREIDLAASLHQSGRRRNAHSKIRDSNCTIRIQQSRTSAATNVEDAYHLTISRRGISIRAQASGGFHCALATLRQLLRQYGRRLPCLEIRDWPDFLRRGVLLDVSRGRVPKFETLLELVEHLADFKINELQLYTEHTFAYRKYKQVWRDWEALTGSEIRKLDKRCRELGIDLVPNQNSFGHLREFLAHPPLKKLAEVAEPYESEDGSFLRRPTTLAPTHPGTLPFLRGLYDELLPNFSSEFFNVGCDETWDLGRGQSKKLCARRGKGRVYLDFLKKIHREVSGRGKRMMFWGDIVLHYPALIAALPRNCIALNWGYEADHPFEKEAARFEKAGIPFYVCPGTSTWMTLIGRHDNALANLKNAAAAGRRHGAVGYLITDWGDGGHPQPLAVSYLPYLAGASLAWCARSFDEKLLMPVLSRDIFADPTQRLAKAASVLGLAHRKLNHVEPNLTPLGTVLAAPPPAERELFCRHGLKYFQRIAPANVRAALAEIKRGRARIARAAPQTEQGRLLRTEFDFAARMAEASCRFMLWQQALASGRKVVAQKLACSGVRDLRQLEREFQRYWPQRNKATPAKCAGFLRWRIEDYRRGTLHPAWRDAI